MINLPKETIPGARPFNAESDVYLEASHICIKKEVAGKVFGSNMQILTIYYPRENTFMAAPSDEELLNSIHKGNQQMLKSKNLAGDKSISVQELLLDNDIDNCDRNLEFVIENELRLLKIKL